MPAEPHIQVLVADEPQLQTVEILEDPHRQTGLAVLVIFQTIVKALAKPAGILTVTVQLLRSEPVVIVILLLIVELLQVAVKVKL